MGLRLDALFSAYTLTRLMMRVPLSIFSVPTYIVRKQTELFGYTRVNFALDSCVGVSVSGCRSVSVSVTRCLSLSVSLSLGVRLWVSVSRCVSLGVSLSLSVSLSLLSASQTHPVKPNVPGQPPFSRTRALFPNPQSKPTSLGPGPSPPYSRARRRWPRHATSSQRKSSSLSGRSRHQTRPVSFR